MLVHKNFDHGFRLKIVYYHAVQIDHRSAIGALVERSTITYLGSAFQDVEGCNGSLWNCWWPCYIPGTNTLPWAYTGVIMGRRSLGITG